MRAHSHLLQPLSVAVQRGNAAATTLASTPVHYINSLLFYSYRFRIAFSTYCIIIFKKQVNFTKNCLNTVFEKWCIIMIAMYTFFVYTSANVVYRWVLCCYVFLDLKLIHFQTLILRIEYN